MKVENAQLTQKFQNLNRGFLSLVTTVQSIISKSEKMIDQRVYNELQNAVIIAAISISQDL